MTEPLVVAVQRLPEAEGLPLPSYMTPNAAGADLCAAVHDDLTLLPGARALVPTGLAIALPPGYEAQIRPRSGLALTSGVTLLNSPGTVDSDYRGPLGILIANFGTEPFVVRRGDRIAQIVVSPVSKADFVTVLSLDETARVGGFGSTGVTRTDGGSR